MIEAVVTFNDGNAITLWARSYDELFERMKKYDGIVHFDARTITSESLRQGRY